MKSKEMQQTPSLTEKQFESQVRDLAKIFGWVYYHTWQSIHSPAGFPDCVMVRPPRLIFEELKNEKGKTTPEQDIWLKELEECQTVMVLEPLVVDKAGKTATLKMTKGIPILTNPEVYLWRPNDIDKVAEILR